MVACRYRCLYVRAFLKAHESHISLQRLRRNQPLTPSDLAELEKMLIEAGGSKALISEAREKSHCLGLFIRSLVGLDHEAVMPAFSEFINGTTATPNQIEFINLIVQELTQSGVMEPDWLFEQPFTNLHSAGPMGIFPQATVLQIVQVLEGIRERAVLALTVGLMRVLPPDRFIAAFLASAMTKLASVG